MIAAIREPPVRRELQHRVEVPHHRRHGVDNSALRVAVGVISQVLREGRALLGVLIRVKEQLPRRRVSKPLRDENTLAPTHRHELVIPVTHPREAGQDTTASKTNPDRVRCFQPRQELRDRLDGPQQALVPDRIHHEADWFCSRLAQAIPDVLDRIDRSLEPAPHGLESATEWIKHVVPDPVPAKLQHFCHVGPAVTDPLKRRTDDVVVHPRQGIAQRVPRRLNDVVIHPANRITNSLPRGNDQVEVHHDHVVPQPLQSSGQGIPRGLDDVIVNPADAVTDRLPCVRDESERWLQDTLPHPRRRGRYRVPRGLDEVFPRPHDSVGQALPAVLNPAKHGLQDVFPHEHRSGLQELPRRLDVVFPTPLDTSRQKIPGHQKRPKNRRADHREGDLSSPPNSVKNRLNNVLISPGQTIPNRRESTTHPLHDGLHGRPEILQQETRHLGELLNDPADRARQILNQEPSNLTQETNQGRQDILHQPLNDPGEELNDLRSETDRTDQAHDSAYHDATNNRPHHLKDGKQDRADHLGEAPHDLSHGLKDRPERLHDRPQRRKHGLHRGPHRIGQNLANLHEDVPQILERLPGADNRVTDTEEDAGNHPILFHAKRQAGVVAPKEDVRDA